MKTGIILLGIVTLVTLLASEAVLSVNVGPTGEVNQSIILDQDMSFTDSGLTVTANDVTIDCQFYKITGSGSGIGISFLNNNNVTVKNCIIENFETALDVNNSYVVLNTSLITNNSRGIVTSGNSALNTDRNSIKNNTINLNNTESRITITAINNWWGTNVTSEIAAIISGTVIYEPHLASDPYGDDDSDSVINLLDNCPSAFNPDQIDSDKDGKGDVCDVDLYLNYFVFDPINELTVLPKELTIENETGYYIIQFEQDVFVNKNISGDLGTFIGAIPLNSYLIKSNLTRSQLKNVSQVRFVDLLQPAYKLSAHLFQIYLTNSSDIFNVEISSISNSSFTYDEIVSMGYSPAHIGDSIILNNISIKDVVKVSKISEIILIDLVSETGFEMDVAVGITNVETVWNNLGLTGRGQIGAIRDAGLDNAQGNNLVNINAAIHPDVGGRILGIMDEGGGTDYRDRGGHGTHVTGIMFGNGTESKRLNPGGTPIIGVANNSGIVFSLSGDTTTGNLKKTLDYSMGLGATVHSNSWGEREGPPGYAWKINQYTPVAKFVDQYVWDHPSLLFVKSAGNQGQGPIANITAPGLAKNILTVGASQNNKQGANINNIAGFSSRHVTIANPTQVRTIRVKPDIVAPGADILSMRSSACTPPGPGATYTFCDDEWGFPGDGTYTDPAALNARYIYMGGTSMATPHVSGSALLVREFLNTYKGNVNPTSALVKAILLNGATPMEGGNALTVPNHIQGWGRLNLSNSLMPLGSSKNLFYKEDEDPNTLDTTGNSISYLSLNGQPIRISHSHNASFTLVWNDEPPFFGGTDVLINDLDLEIQTPSKKLYRGNVFDLNGNSVEITAANANDRDGVNNVEKIVFPNPEDGFYNITIRAKKITNGIFSGKQPFAIVVSPIIGVDSANTTNITYNFTEGDNIYTQAVGLPNDTKVRIAVVAHNRSFVWNETVQITGNPAIKVLNITNVTTTANGTFPDQTIIWNTSGKGKEIFESNGTFNIIVNLSDSGPIWFNNRTDVIDYHKKPGFRVAAISSANESNVSYYFPVGSKIYAQGLNLPRNKDARIVTMVHNESFGWDTTINVTDSTGIHEANVLSIRFVRTTENGTLPERTDVWDTADMEKEVFKANGSFNLFINMSRTGYPVQFNNSTDIVDFRNKVGFKVGAVSAANETNFSYYFPAEGKIYARAVGLPNDTRVQILTLAHVNDNSWGDSVQITNNIGAGNGSFKVMNRSNNINTTGNGTLPDRTLVWNSAGREKEIIESKGEFNLVLNLTNSSNPVWFNNKTDVVDYQHKVGFHVYLANSTNDTGNFNDWFRRGQNVSVSGFGFKPGSKVDIYVFWDKNWVTDHDPLVNSVRNVTNVTIDPQGNLPITPLMRTNRIRDTGIYDIVVDVNQNQKYDKDIDVIDGRMNKPGFMVCSKRSRNVCTVIITSDSSGIPKRLFLKGENIHSRVVAFAFRGGNYKIYTVKSSSPIDDLDGHSLNDISSNGPDTVYLPENQLVDITTNIWPQGSTPGDYETILDSDGDGIFNMDEDGFDPDGFGITQELSSPRFAVDNEGNVHIAALLRECCTITLPGGSVLTNMTLTKVIYGKIPANASYSIDVDHPDYFNWSNALTVTNFTTVYARLTGTRIDPPDIAVDKNNEAHITFGIASGGFEWVIYAKMNKLGQRDVWADATLCDPAQGCVPSSGGIERNFAGDLVIPPCQSTSSGKFLCPGNGVDLLTYWWMDYVQANILFPRISIVNGTVPVILTEVDFTYPDNFYLTQIYPSNFLRQNPIILHPLQPPMFLPQAAAGPSQYSGASLQVAIRNMLPGDNDGGSAWPLGDYSPNASRRMGAIINEVSSVTVGITGSQGRKDGWIYLPIDEYSKGVMPSLLFYNYNLHAEKNKIHVVYSRPETYDRSNYLLDLGSKRKLFYQTIDLTGLNLADSANITYNDDPALYASIDDRDELLSINSSTGTRYIPVPGSEKKISDDVVNDVLPDLDVDSNGIAHFVWQTIDPGTSKGRIKYATSDSLNEKIVAETKIGASQARASIALDSQDDPLVAWVDKESMGPTPPLNGTIFYSKGNNSGGVVTFGSPIEVVNSSEYSPEAPFFEFSQVMTNKNSKTDWTDRVYIGWLDYNPFNNQMFIKIKKTVPHLTMLLVIDGYSSDFLMKNLDLMPNLKDLLKNNPKINGSAKVPLPGNTFSSQASLFTGLHVSKHKIHGDNIAINGTDYLLFDDPDKVNQILSNENIKTIYDYLAEIGKSKAVLGNMYQKGAGYNRPDHMLSGIDWIIGDANYAGVLDYLNDLKNNDQITNNDAADLVTVYLLSNDHGISISADDPAYRNSLTTLDNKIGEITGKLKTQNIFNDTIFVITGDHGLTGVFSNRSLERTDILDPDVIITGELYLNGRFAYYYVPCASNLSSIAPAARVFYNNSYVWNTSKFYGNVENVLVKINNTYSQYSYDGVSDSVSPYSGTLTDFTSDSTPQIILISRTGSDILYRNYFQGSHKSIWGMNSSDYIVPFIITGPGFKLFTPDNGQAGISIPIEDAGVTASYFAGGQKAENITRTLDGKNIFKPQFRVRVGSPIYLHLYDSQGRHTGTDQFGNIETNIPTSSFRILEPSGKKEITLLQAPDKYRIEIEGNGKGRFTLWMEKNTDSESFSIEYPRMMIKEDSLAQVDMIASNSMAMQIDYDRDGVFETIQPPVKNILINENIPESRANASLILVPNNSDISIDVSRSTSAIIDARTINEISNASMDVQKVSDTSLDSSDFYTFGSYLNINFSDNFLNNVENLKLTINYPDHELLPKRLSESSLGMYAKSGSSWIKLNSTLDEGLNLISAQIQNSGTYMLASSDTVPFISSVEAIPSRTNIPHKIIHIQANITDDDAIQSAAVDFMGNLTAMNYDAGKGMFTADVVGPDVNGTFEARVIAEDINNNSISKSAYIVFDLVPPVITITSPQNKLYTTNTIELIYSVDERSNQSYSLDSGSEKDTGNLVPFKSVRVPLENISSGNHSIKVIAVDDLGNRGEEFVDFGIAGQNIRIENLSLEPYYRVGDNVTVSADVLNTLITPETGVEVDLIENSVRISSQVINLSGLERKKISFNYIAGAGRKTIGMLAVPLPDEAYTVDNKVETDILVTNKVPVLFVNDDILSNNSKLLSSLTAAEALKYDYLLWNTHEAGEIHQELLEQFPIVIWFSNEPGSMSFTEREALTGYLNNNGYLMISGKNFGKEGTDFYREYLGAGFVKDATRTVVEGSYRDAIGNGLLLEVSSPGEEINPINGATTSFIYNGGKSAVIKKESNFKTVYFAFDVNDILDNDTRNVVIEKTLKWFNVDVIPPIISDIYPPDGFGLPKDTDRINLTLKTSEVAECRISDSDIPFNEMNIFDSTKSLQHSTSIMNLQNDGHYSFFIKCSDNRKNTGKATTTFFVWNRTFLPPDVEQISDIMVLENQSIKIVVNASDPESDPLSYSISDILSLNFPRPFAAKFIKTGNTFVYKTTFDNAGTYNLKVTVSDGYSNVTRTFRLTVINVNRPPVLSPIGNRSIGENTYFYFDVNATDPDGDELRFSDDTPLFDINPYTGIISFTPKLWQVGIYRVNITVSDGEFIDSEEVWFNVTGINHPPVLDFIQPQFARVGVPFNLTLSAHDADGDPLTFSDNTTLFDISSRGQINFTPAISDIGIYYIEIRVSDGKVEDSKIFNLVVTKTNTPPRILNITQNMSVRRGQIVEIGVEACDPDTDARCV